MTEIEIKDFSPESIARFIELKHFETLYTGNMLRRHNGNVTAENEALPEVLQPNVEKYKKEVKRKWHGVWRTKNYKKSLMKKGYLL